MMQERLAIDEIKSIEIAILDHIDEVCKTNGLRYYLAYGTLIGAVRHQGFVPWDDDVDIHMPREKMSISSVNRVYNYICKVLEAL